MPSSTLTKAQPIEGPLRLAVALRGIPLAARRPNHAGTPHGTGAGEARRAIRAALTDDGRYGLVAYLAHAGAEIVATEALVRTDPAARHALAAGLVAWAVPDALAAAIARAAAITEPARTAAMLARLPILQCGARALGPLSGLRFVCDTITCATEVACPHGSMADTCFGSTSTTCTLRCTATSSRMEWNSTSTTSRTVSSWTGRSVAIEAVSFGRCVPPV